MIGNGQDNGPSVALDPANLACIALLESVLASAKNGQITSVGVIACGPSDFGAQLAGPDARSIYLGCGVLQATIVNNVTSPGAAPQRPTIIRPGAPRPRPVPRG